jgi:hypothetical protein
MRQQFNFDDAISEAAAARHARPQRQISSPKANREKMTSGTVCRLLEGGSCFVVPDGHDFTDRSSTVFCHRMALVRSGIPPDDLMVGARLEFSTKAGRHPSQKPEAFDLELIAA